jgi:serine/threonine protein phosphatase PrpC
MMQPEPASSVRLKIEFAQASDPGRDPNKQVNEDSCGYAETKLGHLCVLCDGMGGHYGGKEASRTAITTIFELFEQLPPSTSPSAALKSSIEEAARRVYLLGGPPENRTRPGSTVVAMLFHDRGVDVAHVGDSRAYVIRAGQIYPLTRDHSMVQGMIDAGMLTEEQAIGHPDANKITRALGMKPEVDVEVRPEPMELFAGDVLLQSSDGLTDLALGADILAATRQALASGPVSHACNTLVQLANNRGGHDNITVQMVRIVEVAPKGVVTIPGAPGSNAGARLAPALTPTAPPNAPVETISMTKPEQRAPQAAYGAPGHAGHHAATPGNAGMQWAPVLPTATDVPAGGQGLHGTRVMSPAGAPAAQSPGPTINEAPPSQRGPAQPWSSGMYTGPPVTAQAGPPPGLQPYGRDGGPGALPLPPPSARQPMMSGQPFAPPGPTQVAYGTPAPTAVQPMPYAPMPASMSAPSVRPSKGGIVFVIIGLSAVIAVLIIVLLWALVLR